MKLGPIGLISWTCILLGFYRCLLENVKILYNYLLLSGFLKGFCKFNWSLTGVQFSPRVALSMREGSNSVW